MKYAPGIDREWLDWALTISPSDVESAGDWLDGKAARDLLADWPFIQLAQRLAFQRGYGHALNALSVARRAAA